MNNWANASVVLPIACKFIMLAAVVVALVHCVPDTPNNNCENNKSNNICINLQPTTTTTSAVVWPPLQISTWPLN